MLVLFERLLQHSAKMALMLPEEEEGMGIEMHAQVSVAEERKQELLELLPEKFTTSEAISMGNTINMEKRTVEDHLRDLCRNKSVVRISRGKYKKV